jgi:hypothetical protein
MNFSKIRYKQKFLLVFFIFILFGCNKKTINFDEYIKEIMFNKKEILENKIYPIENFEYKARTIYTENGTHFNIYANPNEEQVLYAIKYWTKIEIIEIINIEGIFLAKIKPKEKETGWINAFFIELY